LEELEKKQNRFNCTLYEEKTYLIDLAPKKRKTIEEIHWNIIKTVINRKTNK
jgi:hypothetical protein